jgi:O-acetylhomoserine/O-acetylserine sulfhydrylase-like pyridoxal-dependent enzyme
VASHVSQTTAHQLKHRFPPLGVDARFIDDGEVAKVRSAIDEDTKAVFVESLSTERLVVANITALAAVAHENGIPLIVYVHNFRPRDEQA